MDHSNTYYANCWYRCFCVGDKPIRKWLDAKKLIDSDEKVTMFVNVIRHGIWETEIIDDYREYMASVDVIAGGITYHIVKKEKPILAKHVLFYVEGENAISGASKNNLLRVEECLNEGKNVRAEVEFFNGGTHITQKLINIWPSKRSFETAMHSIYRC